MKVLITGHLGYIGSWMTLEAVERGHEVVGLDTGFYDDTLFYPRPVHVPELRKDVRDVHPRDLEGFDAIIHLAELSNDPLGALRPELTRQINFEGSVGLARAAHQAGVPRFLYSSSCSVYGIGRGNDVKTETATPAPQTEYARCKVLVEQALRELADDNFSPLCFRNATAYGPSPSMRFDLVLNNLAGHAYTRRRIAMTSDGTPWRPLVHVRDICQAFLCALDTPREQWHNQILNVGDSAENYQVRDIAHIVADVFPGCETTFGHSDPDTRSYRVDCSRIRQVLPSFRCRFTARDGAEQLRETFERVGLTLERFEHRAFTRLAQLKYWLERGDLAPDLRWASRVRSHGGHPS